MARVKIDDIVEHLDDEFSRALEKALKRTFPGIEVNRRQFFRAFQSALDNEISTWETVPDRCVDAD